MNAGLDSQAQSYNALQCTQTHTHTNTDGSIIYILKPNSTNLSIAALERPLGPHYVSDTNPSRQIDGLYTMPKDFLKFLHDFRAH